jgi:hypothetical protein
VTAPSPRKLTRRDRLLLIFGFFGPHAAWTVHLLAGYGYEEAACANGTGVGVVEPFIIGLTVVLGAATVAAGLASLTTLREVKRGELDDPRGRVRFVATFGLLSVPIFLAIIVLGGLMLLALNPCVQT